MIVADALNFQKETAEIIVKQQADYLLSVKDNHLNLKKDIENYIQDSSLQSGMHSMTRTAFVTTESAWLEQKKEWINLCCIGAIHTEFTTKKGKSSEWHYYISSRMLSAEELRHHARWSGRLSRCTGCLMSILKRIGVVFSIEQSNKI